MVTPEELDEKRQRNYDLRAQIQAEKARRAAELLEVAGVAEAEQLDKEAERLEAELVALQESHPLADQEQESEETVTVSQPVTQTAPSNLTVTSSTPVSTSLNLPDPNASDSSDSDK